MLWDFEHANCHLHPPGRTLVQPPPWFNEPLPLLYEIFRYLLWSVQQFDGLPPCSVIQSLCVRYAYYTHKQFWIFFAKGFPDEFATVQVRASAGIQNLCK